MDFEKINKLAESKGFTIKTLAKKIDVAYSGLYRSIKERTIKVETLEDIANALEVPVTVFFEDENENLNKPALIEEVKKLYAELEDVWKRHDDLEDIIRAKRALLRRTYNDLKQLNYDRLNEIIVDIEESERFENPPVRAKRKVLVEDIEIYKIEKGDADTIDKKNPIVETRLERMIKLVDNMLTLQGSNPIITENYLELKTSLEALVEASQGNASEGKESTKELFHQEPAQTIAPGKKHSHDKVGDKLKNR